MQGGNKPFSTPKTALKRTPSMKKSFLVLILSFTMFSFLKKQTEDIPTTWNRFENWLTKNASHLLSDLNAPASQDGIEKLEKSLKVKLPKEYIEFLKIHDGQNQNSEEGLIDTEELLSSDRILSEWTVWKNLLDDGDFKGYESTPEKGIKSDWWNPKWIPITHDGSGNFYGIDLDPAQGGKSGQIIRMWHDSDERELIANSFQGWISKYVEDLEKGNYVYSEEWGGIINKEDL